MGFVARPLNIARCGASFKVTDGHRLTGSDVGLYIYLRRLRATGLAVWSSFDIRLNLHLSLKMDDTGGGKRLRWHARIDAAETQLAIPERGQSIDFAVRSSAERRGSSPRKMRLNIARCVSMARSTASLPITTRACAIRLRATPHDGARLRSTSHRKTAAVLWAKPSHAIGAAAAWAGFDVRLDFHLISPGWG